MIGIYKITSPSKRIYIGQSVDIERRFETYKNTNQVRKQLKLYNSFKKYGVDNHVFEIIQECEISELNDLERYYQDLYCVITSKGLNCKLTKSSDRSGKHSKETCEKKRIANTGKKHTEETKKILSTKAKGRKLSPIQLKNFPSYWKGKKRTDSDRKKKSINSAKFWLGKKQSVETCMKKKANASRHNSKIVLDTSNGIYYSSAKEVSVLYKITHSTLRNKLNGTYKNNTNFIYA